MPADTIQSKVVYVLLPVHPSDVNLAVNKGLACQLAVETACTSSAP
jgi:hypothetical protein